MNRKDLRRTRLEIYMDNILENYKNIRAHVGNTDVISMAVVKADAYGHGDVGVCKALFEHTDIRWFGVSNFEEALSIRRVLPQEKTNILIFSYAPPETAALLAKMNISQTVYSLEYALLLNREAEKNGVKVKVHLKIDSGMGRLGLTTFDISETVRVSEEILALKHLEVEGIYTHFSHDDEESGNEWTRKQFSEFMEVLLALEARGHVFRYRHTCNSGGILRFPEMYLDMVRIGIILYGEPPSKETRDIVPLKDAMSLKGVLNIVKEVKAGSYVGYGQAFYCERDTLVGAISIGYADGYQKDMSRKGHVMIFNQKAPIIGGICMDQMMIDLTDVRDSAGNIAQMGDDVFLLGYARPGEKGVSFQEAGDWIQTMNYELFCKIGKRIPRVNIVEGVVDSVEVYKDLAYEL